MSRESEIVRRFESRPAPERGPVLLEAARQMNSAPEDELERVHWTDYLENALDLHRSSD